METSREGSDGVIDPRRPTPLLDEHGRQRVRLGRLQVTVLVEEAEGPPIDLEAWARLFVATLMRLDAEDCGGITPP